MFNSIKLKLVIWFLVVFSMMFVGLEVFMYYKLQAVVISLVDDHLKSTTHSLGNLIRIEDEHGQMDMGLAELSQATTGSYAEKLSGHYYQITSRDGKVLVRSPSLALAGATLPVEHGVREDVPRYETVPGPDKRPMRMATQSFKYPNTVLTFQAAESLAETSQLMSSFKKTVVLIFPAIFIFSGIGVFVITGLALKSLKAFTAKVSLITEENLNERLDEKDSVAELQPLASSFNTMLGRLEGSFTRQRQFLSDASHELRTPTSIIKSFCDVTLGRERAAGDYRDAIKKISDTVNRMCDIINRILVVSRLDNKASQFKQVRVDLKDIMKDVLKLIESSAENKGVKITLSGAGVNIRGDKEGLTEVFTNIIENAIKYNKQGGRVDVVITEVPDWAAVSVSDTGIGIPAADIDKIFDRFYRVDASRSLTVGSGLGLSIVRAIVESHGGRIEVSSEIGAGSTFTVNLPKKS